MHITANNDQYGVFVPVAFGGGLYGGTMNFKPAIALYRGNGNAVFGPVQ